MTGRTFTKSNPLPGSQSLVCEAEDLQHLRQALQDYRIDGISIPGVRPASPRSMVLDYIDSHPATDIQWQQLGQALAQLHQVTHPQCGYHRDNFIGLSSQPNLWSDSWGDFFVQYRLTYQVGLIRMPEVRQAFQAELDQMGPWLALWLNQHCTTFSLLHGDLWSGNVLFDRDKTWLIDPAVYYGDREVDLAMTEMFGGFPDTFYQYYDRTWRRSSQYPHKRMIYNLYHYLNHYNLFGESYLAGCQQGFQFIRSLYTTRGNHEYE